MLLNKLCFGRLFYRFRRSSSLLSYILGDFRKLSSWVRSVFLSFCFTRWFFDSLHTLLLLLLLCYFWECWNLFSFSLLNRRRCQTSFLVFLRCSFNRMCYGLYHLFSWRRHLYFGWYCFLWLSRRCCSCLICSDILSWFFVIRSVICTLCESPFFLLLGNLFFSYSPSTDKLFGPIFVFRLSYIYLKIIWVLKLFVDGWIVFEFGYIKF